MLSSNDRRSDEDDERWMIQLLLPADLPITDMSLKLSFARFAVGRRSIRTIPAIAPRPELIADIMCALQDIASTPLSRTAMQGYRSALTDFWSYLDMNDDERSLSQFVGPPTYRLRDVPGTLWDGFPSWLSANIPASESRFFSCKRILNLAAALLAKQGIRLAGFPLTINRPKKGPSKRQLGKNDSESESKWLVRGYDAESSIGWTVTLESFALGQPQNGKRASITGRPGLANNILGAIQQIVDERKVDFRSAKRYYYALTRLWSALDIFEQQETTTNDSDSATEVIAVIPGKRWACFRDLLSKNPTTAYATYNLCKTLCDKAATLIGGLYGFPLAPNPFRVKPVRSQIKRLAERVTESSEWIVYGKPTINVGHGLEPWEVSCATIVYGRRAIGAASSLKARASLGAEIVPTLQEAVQRNPLTRESFVAQLNAIYKFYRFLDEMENVAESAGEHFAAPLSITEIPGTTWMLFKNWLAAGTASAHLVYYHCSRAFDFAASQLAATNGRALSGFPLPLNPFPNPQKSAAMRPAQTDVTLDLEEAYAISAVLFDRVRITTERIEQQRSMMANDTERGLHLRKWLTLAEDHAWRLENVQARQLAEINEVVGLPEMQFEKVVRNNRLAAGFWLVPSRSEVMLAFALVMLRTGWNTSTTLDIDSTNWWKAHPTSSQTVEVFSRKARANGNVQQSYSNKYIKTHPYQVLTSVLKWTEPLRNAIANDLERNAEGRSVISPISDKRRGQLRNMSKRVWLYLASNNILSIDRLPVCCLDRDVKYDVVNEVLRSEGLLHRGEPIRFMQEVSRATWAGFTYEVTGYNLLVTQVALGHSNLDTLLSYINQRAIRNRHRREWFNLQQHVISEIENGRLSPRTLRELIEKGELTDAEASDLESGGTRTRQGMTCVNPYAPDAFVDPSHKAGRPCGTQACLSGCSKAFATIDALEFIARRILELRGIRDTMPLFAWTESEHPHDLEFLEAIAEQFSAENQRRAFALALENCAPVIYTVPSRLAKSATGAN
jgi:hypothetical protein